MLRGLFVTGTDTGVGKTVVSAALMHRYRAMVSLRYWKPIQTGIDTDDGPLAGVSVALDGHGRLYALATRKAVDELGLARGDPVFALVKTVALDERAVAPAGL